MTYEIKCIDNSLGKGLQHFFAQLLKAPKIDALFMPLRLKDSTVIMPSLISDADVIADTVPLSPCFMLNASQMVSRLSYKESSRITAVLLRPCEMRAFIELTKLKQGSRKELILIGIDCPKALSSTDYKKYTEKDPLGDDAFIKYTFSGGDDTVLNGFEYSSACNTCENPFPEQTDINIMVHGVDLSKGIMVEGISEIGQKTLKNLELKKVSIPEKRKDIISQIKKDNTSANEAMIKNITLKTDSIPKLNLFFDQCINCYNCRNMCPVCYCRECVFNTDVFYHQPVQYHQWAEKEGAIKMPTDTVFYHLTRMVHMSHACVGCGQCSNACPSGIHVSELFKSVANITQTAFEYHPGEDENDPPPLSIFFEKEFEDSVGIIPK